HNLFASRADLHVCPCLENARRLKQSLPLHLHDTDPAKGIGRRRFVEADGGNLHTNLFRGFQQSRASLHRDLLSVNCQSYVFSHIASALTFFRGLTSSLLLRPWLALIAFGLFTWRFGLNCF